MGMFRNLFEGPHLILIAVVIIVLFGWKKLPDVTRSVGRSMRIFKSEMGEMKTDGKESSPSPAASDTVKGTATPPPAATVPPVQVPLQKPMTVPTQASPVQQDQPVEPAAAPHDATR